MFPTPRRDAAKLLLTMLAGGALLPARRALAQTGGQAGGQGGGTMLDMAVSAPPTSVDPHYHTLTPNFALGSHIFEQLVDRTPEGKPVPGLAESWKAIDDKTWEFRLRRGVKWHNGQDFTAEDVAYTIERVPNVVNSPGSYAIYTKPIARVEIVDPHTVRFHTHAVNPLMVTDMSQVAIIWHGLGPNPSTGDFNNGRNAIGTGPFRLESYQSGNRAVFVRNEDYWGRKPHWAKVNYRFIPNDGARVAALQAGDVQFIDAVPTSDITRVRKEPHIAISETTSLRSIYLRTDFRTDGPSPYVTGPNGEKLDKNPLLDHRVREALSIAINRQGIAERIMSGAALPTGQFMPPGAYGYAQDIKAPPYDPARAKALLAEAGFPNGLGITLNSSNDRYVNDAQIAQTIGQMWSRIGVKTQVDTVPFAVNAQRSARRDFSVTLGGWSNSTGEPSSGLRGLLGTRDVSRGWGTVNQAGYSSAEYDRLVEQGLVTVDDEKREQLWQQATRVAVRDIAWIPLHTQVNVWAMRDTLKHTPRADEMTRAMDVSPRQ
ncbi:ABC transporter substrate-binding protein [Roseomonas gilardii]|uniref:ABC transporter substrate-binding protein n=1 Tax=Roseomonas gilardii TaxID=257708 RepID=UPI000488BB7A|nr:ABC transporter substrate-binding protein [Roseomonas gilardii]SUE62921.1 Hemin-binding lipoprotein [Roseomonas gilardii subsp. rosea]